MSNPLPSQILPQSMPIAEQDGHPIYVSFDWYLFLYSLSKQVFGTGGGGSTPVSASDLIDADDLLAVSADIPQAYRQIANLQALFPEEPIGPTLRDMANALILAQDGLLPDPAPRAQPAQTITVGASPFTWTAPFNGTLSVVGSSSAGSFTNEKGSGGTFGFAAGVDYTAGTSTTLTLSQNYGSAANLWVAFDGDEQGADQYSLSGTTLTFTSAIPAGPSKVFVKGFLPSASGVSAISIIRQGVTVGTGITSGLVPVSRLDQVQITYSSTPTVVFLPT